MDPVTIGALISGGSSILGGILGKSSADKAAATQMQIAQQNIALQKQFAQEGIQWKVADAQKAGVHPLFALGAQTSSFSPVSVGSTADNSLGEGLSKAGQEVGRAVAATADNELRSLQRSSILLDLEKKGLENDVLRAELGSKFAVINQPGTLRAGIPIPSSDPRKIPGDSSSPVNQLRIGGNVWDTDPTTSSMKDWEDRYGDEGPMNWIGQIAVAMQDIKHQSSSHAQLDRLFEFRFGTKAPGWAHEYLKRLRGVAYN